MSGARRAWSGSAILCLLLAGRLESADSHRRLEEIEKRIHETEQEKQSIEAESEGVLGEMDGLDRGIDAHERRVRELAAEIRAAQSCRQQAERRAAELDAALARLKDRFAARARGLYRLSRRGWAPVVFQVPRELSDALRTLRALEAVLGNDRALLDEMRQNRAEAVVSRTEAAAAAALLTQGRADKERELAALRSERAAKQEMLASLRSEGEKRSQLLGELKSSAEKLRSLLQREEEASKAAPFEPATPPSSGMLPPLGAMSKEISTARNGVEIRAALGASIRAVAAGRVVFADWFTGYGKMVILDHGRHLYSIYGYATDLLVERGRIVKAGESIATVGATGPAPAPSLYFEIRDHGAPRDPGAYIPMLARRGQT